MRLHGVYMGAPDIVSGRALPQQLSVQIRERHFKVLLLLQHGEPRVRKIALQLVKSNPSASEVFNCAVFLGMHDDRACLTCVRTLLCAPYDRKAL